MHTYTVNKQGLPCNRGLYYIPVIVWYHCLYVSDEQLMEIQYPLAASGISMWHKEFAVFLLILIAVDQP